MSGYSTPCAPCGGCVATKPMPLCIDSLTFTDLPPNTLVTITFENMADGSVQAYAETTDRTGVLTFTDPMPTFINGVQYIATPDVEWGLGGCAILFFRDVQGQFDPDPTVELCS